MNWPTPLAGEVHLYVVNLDAHESLLRDAPSVLSPDERSRAARLKFESDRRTFTAARTFLRATLSRYADERPERLRFRYGPFGRPELESPATRVRIRFNLSHSANWAVLGVALDDVGVDVELVRPIPELEDIARTYFSPREAEALSRADGADRLVEFFRHWTRREALLKAVGHGLDDATPDSVGGDWSVLAPDFGDDLVAAVAVRQKDARLSMRLWSTN